MKTRTIVSVIVIMIFGFLLTGCQHSDDEIKVKDPEVLKELQFMKNKGIITSEDYKAYINMEEMPTKWGNTEVYFPSCEKNGLLDCDQVYPREMIQNMMKEDQPQNTSASARHRRSLYMFTSNGGTITVRTTQNVPLVWKTAISQAITEWNNLGYKVKFAGISGTTNSTVNGYLNIEYGDTTLPNKPTDTQNLARANWPLSAGAFGQVIRINSQYYNNPNNLLTASARKFAMVHEIGHTIGLQHTHSTLSTSLNVYDVASQIKCNGTANYLDFTSVMRPTIQPNTVWEGFTPCDKAVIDYYW